MSRLPALAALLAATFALAACGGSQSGSQQDSSSPPEQSQTEPATQNEATESAPRENAQSEDAQGGEEPGTSVTTLDGEQIDIGGGEATALFFMAGW